MFKFGFIILYSNQNEHFKIFFTSNMTWVTSYIAIIQSILGGTPRIITTQPLSAELILDILVQHKIKAIFTVPSMIARMVKILETESHDLSELELMLTSGTVLSDHLAESLKVYVPKLILIAAYGMTEAGGIISSIVVGIKPNSVGFLSRGVQIKVS